MIRKIYHKVITSGNITEIYSYENGVLMGFMTDNKSTGRLTNISEEERQARDKQNFLRSLSRTVQTLRRTINSNINEWGSERPKFMTLTFRENVIDHEIANKEFREFIKRINRHVFKRQSGLKYTCVVERQTRGAIHYHVLFYNLPYVKQDKLVQLWENGKEQRGLRVNAINDIDNVGAYVVKYIEKDIEAMRKGFKTKTGKSAKEKDKKLFFQSQGLIKPNERGFETDEELREFESALITNDVTIFEATHDNEYIGKMTYKQIKKKTE